MTNKLENREEDYLERLIREKYNGDIDKLSKEVYRATNFLQMLTCMLGTTTSSIMAVLVSTETIKWEPGRYLSAAGLLTFPFFFFRAKRGLDKLLSNERKAKLEET